MLAYAKNVMLMAILISSVAQAAISLTKECMSTTENLGNPDRTGATFTSNMGDLVDKLQGKEIFMRTAGLFVCYGADKIYGVRIVLEHDVDKDPNNTQLLSVSGKNKKNSNIYYEHMIGAQEENCNLIRIGRDTWI